MATMLPGAEGAVLEGTKDIMLAAMTEQRAEEEADENLVKSKNLKARVVRIKGEITREAIAREAAMHDKDESIALTAAIKAIQDGDTERAAAVLKDRLSQVRSRRRRALFSSGSVDDSDDSDDSDNDAASTGTSTGSGMLNIPAQLSQREWESVVSGQLSAACAPAVAQANSHAPVDTARIADLRAQLDHGAHVLAAPQPGAAELSATILDGLRQLRLANISPFFIWMFDEPWQLLRSFWSDAEELLGGECVLEPTFAAYHLNPQLAKQAKGRYVGTNFGLPHRDYTFTDSHMANGAPKILTMWVPVTAVTSENGCMYVVPKEFDENFDKDSVYEHMVVQTTGWMAGKSHLSFPIAGARPLAPAAAGALCAWYGNVIHWGAHCHSSKASDPRASVAWVFRLASATRSTDNPPLTRAEVDAGLSLERRRQLLLRSMDCFQHWTGAESVSGEETGRGYGGGHKPPRAEQIAEEERISRAKAMMSGTTSEGTDGGEGDPETEQ